MSNAPVFDIDPTEFWNDPYPALQQMREIAPICFVPQLGATLFAKRDDIRICEKNIEVFSSHQPGGLMNVLMGQNLMRKDGEPHFNERKAIFPTVSPKNVRNYWTGIFEKETAEVLDEVTVNKNADLVREIAMPIGANALRQITGLTNMAMEDMNSWSQAMIDGIANYSGDKDVEARCNSATAGIDACIDARIEELQNSPDLSLLGVLLQTDLPMESVRADIKLAISGGQNEIRDVIAGMVWALLTHPEQMHQVKNGEFTWAQVFEEYVRWLSPVGMSPRRIAKEFEYEGVTFEPEDRVFLMFSSANRDASGFEDPEEFNIARADASGHIAFGAGPHFCAGAAASKALIADVALPAIFERLPNLRLQENAKIEVGGWAFRGLFNLPVAWD